jgi:hypothetical protein
MTTDTGMDADELPVGWERTIYHLQQRIRLLESALAMAHQLLQDMPNNPLNRSQCNEIQRLLNE